MKKLFLLGATLALSCAAYSIPTITGPTGTYELPNAEIATGTSVAVDNPVNAFEGVFRTKIPNIKAVHGFSDKFEAGIMVQRLADFTNENYDLWNLNAKYALPSNSPSTQYAVGAMYGEFIDGHAWQVYGSATTTMLGTLKGSATLGYADGSDDSGLTFGVSAEMPVADKLTAGAEFFFGNEVGGTTHGNLYANYQFSDKLVGRVALSGIGQNTENSFGAAYIFGE